MYDAAGPEGRRSPPSHRAPPCPEMGDQRRPRISCLSRASLPTRRKGRGTSQAKTKCSPDFRSNFSKPFERGMQVTGGQPLPPASPNSSYGCRCLLAAYRDRDRHPVRKQRLHLASFATVRFPGTVRTLPNREVPIYVSKTRLSPVPPTSRKRTVEMPRRLANAEYRRREYLTPAEVERLMKAVGKNRHGHRDATMVLVCYRHGLRVSELVSLEWSQVDFNAANLHVRRVKGSTDAVHPILGEELRALRRLRREQEPKSAYVFTSERGAPFSTAGFLRMVQRAGEAAGLGFPVHPHMLRHATGFKLANDGVDTRTLQAYLGHKSIGNTVRYTELSPTRFKDLWR